MSPEDLNAILKRFEQADEVREMPNGRFEVVRVGGMTVGRATYEHGWRWSEHVGPAPGQTRCSVEHVGMVVSGATTEGWSKSGDGIKDLDLFASRFKASSATAARRRVPRLRASSRRWPPQEK
jgi:hypothetical protein